VYDVPNNNKEMTITKRKVAIVGGGMTGAVTCRRLSKCPDIHIDLFDQGRRGVGGRTSSRRYNIRDGNGEAATVRFDHGCQFFRADTDRFKKLVHEWIEKGHVSEWKGDFRSSTKQEHEFFGLPSTPPFYVAIDGMQTLSKNILIDASASAKLHIHSGVRIAQLDRDAVTKKWRLIGTSGEAAYHDTSEKLQLDCQRNVIGEELGYDAVILTDISSSFGGWHRASARVPDSFSKAVRDKVGARVPLFTAMIAFDSATAIPFDAASFDHPVVWFAAKTSSKPQMKTDKECWTIVSTPSYACDKIEETPMQDEKTGTFIPQSPDYLTTVPGPELLAAFEEIVCGKAGILGDDALCKLPKHVFMDAQRWGSALPCHRHLRHESSTRKVLSDVPYDSALHPLAPTRIEEEDSKPFLADDDLALYQAGDMISDHTPGLEGACLSGIDVAEHLLAQFGLNG
jgi:predicted NAD/FAD-dependent oxidoreductase